MNSWNARVLLIWAAIIGLALVSFSVFRPFLLSLGMGFTFAIALAPTHRAIVSRFKFKRRTASLVVSVLFVLVIFAPIAFATFKILSYATQHTRIVSELATVENTFLKLLTSINTKFHLRIDTPATRQMVQSTAESTRDYVVANAKEMAASIPDAIVQFTVMILTIFVVLLNQRKVFSRGFDFLGISQSCATQVSSVFYAVCRDVVFANVMTGAMQAALVTAGVVLFTDFDPLLTFVFTFIVSFIPVIGAAPVLVGIALYMLIDNNYSVAVGLLALSIVVGLSDNIMRAKLMTGEGSDRIFIDLLASIGGIYVWGFAGIFMGPFAVILSAKLIPLLLKEVNRTRQTEIIIRP